MKFNAADISAMLAAMGTDIAVDGLPYTGHFHEAGKVVPLYDGSMITTGPILILSEKDAGLVTENSTIITINASDYVALRKLPDGAGFVELELTKDF